MARPWIGWLAKSLSESGSISSTWSGTTDRQRVPYRKKPTFTHTCAPTGSESGSKSRGRPVTSVINGWEVAAAGGSGWTTPTGSGCTAATASPRRCACAPPRRASGALVVAPRAAGVVPIVTAATHTHTASGPSPTHVGASQRTHPTQPGIHLVFISSTHLAWGDRQVPQMARNRTPLGPLDLIS